MSQNEGLQTTSHTATQPIINIRDEGNAHNISWEVRYDNPTSALEEPIKEEPPKEEEKVEEKPEEELIENEVEEQKEPEDEDNLEKKKPLRAPKDKRFADFTRKIKQRDGLIKEYSAENDYLKQQLALQKEEKLKDESKYITSQITTIKKAYSDALSEGDNETATEAASLLAQYTARQESLSQQKYQMELSRQNSRPQNQQQPQDTQSPDLSEEFQINGKAWLQNNPWADAKSVNYDQDMLQEAESHVESLMKQYKFEGRAEEIGTPDFFNEITQHVRESFGISPSPSKPPKDKLVMKGDIQPGVAPVSRNSNTSNHVRSKQEVHLTPEQISFAHSMAGKVSLNGQKVTDKAKLEAIYKANLIQQSKRG